MATIRISVDPVRDRESGLVYLLSVLERRPYFRIKAINGLEIKECITGEAHRPLSDLSIEEEKKHNITTMAKAMVVYAGVVEF